MQSISNDKSTLLVLSANDQISLEQLVEKYRAYLSGNTVPIKDIAYTLGARRDHMQFRTFGIVSSGSFNCATMTKCGPILLPVFIFTGQGAQWPEMGKGLMADYDSFREDIRNMDETLSQLKHAPLWTIEGMILDSC
jgi:acyl transferase domain-containing protein